jgi:glycosyltransferase involved in cell wall biosynthesis
VPNEPELLVSVVMPCLNEAETVERCVRSAREAIAAAGLAGEVVVADNGSSDGSQRLAEAAGARVVPVPEKGYGAALLGGIAAARGKWVVMGDADDSYDFGAVPRFVEELERGHDLVMGTRIKGRIEKGAMPFLHRWLGNPVLTGLGRLFFRVPVSDFHCGLRGFRQDLPERLGLKTTGMEFATEMVVKAGLFGAPMSEIPVTLRPDGRSRPPHLRTWRDGWRHLRFLLVYSPRWLYLYPGLILAAIGAALLLWLVPGPRPLLGTELDVHAMLGAAAMVFIGVEAVTFGFLAKVFGITEGLLPIDPRLEKAFRHLKLETGLLLSAALLIAGFALCFGVVLRWGAIGFGHLPLVKTLRAMIPGVLLLLLGAHGILSSFFLSMLGLRRR